MTMCVGESWHAQVTNNKTRVSRAQRAKLQQTCSVVVGIDCFYLCMIHSNQSSEAHIEDSADNLDCESYMKVSNEE